MLKKPLKRSIEKVANLVFAQIKPRIDQEAANQSDVAIVLARALNEQGPSNELAYPVLFVETLRKYLQRDEIGIKAIREPEKTDDLRLRSIRRELEIFPAIEYAAAHDLARFADSRLRDSSPFEGRLYRGSSAIHFYFSSSLGKKARILYNIVRSVRPARCLEIGTAWGMSTTVIAEAQRSLGLDLRVVTIELNEPQASKAKEVLSARYGESISCMKGRSDDLIPVLRKEGMTFDFLFNDGAHNGDAYVRTFHETADLLQPGSAMLIDDIKWDAGANRWKTSEASKRTCYEGWLEIARDRRTSLALELDSNIGMIILN